MHVLGAPASEAAVSKVLSELPRCCSAATRMCGSDGFTFHDVRLCATRRTRPRSCAGHGIVRDSTDVVAMARCKLLAARSWRQQAESAAFGSRPAAQPTKCGICTGTTGPGASGASLAIVYDINGVSLRQRQLCAVISFYNAMFDNWDLGTSHRRWRWSQSLALLSRSGGTLTIDVAWRRTGGA